MVNVLELLTYVPVAEEHPKLSSPRDLDRVSQMASLIAQLYAVSRRPLYVLLCAMAILPDGMRERFSSKEYLIHFNPLECFNPFTQILH